MATQDLIGSQSSTCRRFCFPFMVSNSMFHIYIFIYIHSQSSQSLCMFYLFIYSTQFTVYRKPKKVPDVLGEKGVSEMKNSTDKLNTLKNMYFCAGFFAVGLRHC